LASTPIKVGVVGLGSFGSHHARHYAAHAGAVLAAVADLDVARSRQVAAEYGCDALADPREMRGRVDAVSVAVPASFHAAVTRDLLDAGIHVLVEKPLATTSEDGRDLVARASRAGVVLQVGHIERFSPAVEALLERVSEPRRISCVRHTAWNGRSTDVDVILDLMIHDIDLVLALAPSPVTSVAASGAVVQGDRIDEAEAWLTFAGGTIATLSASRAALRGQRRVVVTEAGATYTADLSVPSLSVAGRERWGSAPEEIALVARDNLGAEIDAFLTSVAGHLPPRVDGAAGVAALEIAERIVEALTDSDTPARRFIG
jgi:predicted dehydrogenase